jgi:AbrB family looped-hinge helix DNA binding protein
MKTTIDKAGRLVIPAGMRAKVGLLAGGEVEVAVHGAAIIIEPLNGLDLESEGPFLVIPSTGHPTDDAAVREARLGDQR